jgi:hypothetical protein
MRVRYLFVATAWILCAVVLPRLYFARRNLDMYELIVAGALLMVTAFLTLYVVLDRDNGEGPQ